MAAAADQPAGAASANIAADAQRWKQTTAAWQTRMSSEGKATLDLAVDNLLRVFRGDAPVANRQLQKGDIAKQFEERPPDQPTAEFEKLLHSVDERVLQKGLTHWQSPKFFGYFPAVTSPPAMFGEILIASCGQVGLQWASSPAATELECVAMDWVLSVLGLDGRHSSDDAVNREIAEACAGFFHRKPSSRGGGVIQNTASDGLLTILAAVKHRQMAKLVFPDRHATYDFTEDERDEIFSSLKANCILYTSAQVHFSTIKAARIAGFKIRRIAASAENSYALTAADVRKAIEADLAADAGVPTAIVLTHGTTNICACDDIESFTDLKADYPDLYLHVDAAYGGSHWALPGTVRSLIGFVRRGSGV